MIKLMELLDEKAPCWKGYKQIGMKKKDGREVPNCVPIDENVDEAFFIGEDDIEEYDVENNYVNRTNPIYLWTRAATGPTVATGSETNFAMSINQVSTN